MGDLDCGGLYFGGAGVAVPLPSSVPDYGQSQLLVTTCTPGLQTFTLAATGVADTGDIRSCTSGTEPNTLYPACVGAPNAGKPCRANPDCAPGTCTGFQPGCLYGAPLPVPNANTSATSNCIINRIVTNATGNGTCAGASNINFDLLSDLYLTGDLLPGEPGVNPCPLCKGGTPVCIGGPNNGVTCTPGSILTIGDAYPVSHDCPPPVSTFIGSLPIPYALTTGTSSKPSFAAGGQVNVFCGFCRSLVPPKPFRNPPQSCTSNADCTTAPFTACQQSTEGVFGNGLATNYTETGTPAGCLDDGFGHPSTLVSTFCIPPSYNGIVDGAADLPGPGAVSLPGTAQLLP
jgi:hypothetical protein